MNFIDQVFKPSMKVMAKLKFRAKFTIIVTLFLAPLALVGFFFLREINALISFAANERIGVSYDRVAHAELAGILEAAVRGESPEVSRDQLDAVDTQYGAGLKSHDALLKTYQASNSLERATALKDLIVTVGNNSQLVLDPDIDSYYTMDSVIVQVPNASVAATEAGMRAARLAQRGDLTTRNRTELAVLLADLRRSIGNVSGNYGQAHTVNPAVSSLEPSLQKVQTRYEALSSLLDEHFIQADRADTTPAEVQEATSKLLEALNGYHGELLGTLDRLLLARKEGFEARRSTVATLVLLSLLTAGYLLFGVYLSMMKSIREVVSSSKRLSEGDLQHAVIAYSRDEVGALAKDLEQIRLSFREMSSAASQMARGDLTVQMPVRSDRDELGQALVGMVSGLRSAITTVKQASESLRDASQELANSASEGDESAKLVADIMSDVHRASSEGAEASTAVAVGCEEQAAAALRSHEALAELQGRVEEVMQATEGQRGVAEATSKAAEVGGEALRETLKRVQQLQDECLESSRRVQALGEMGNSIGSIVGTIGEIADQTNLLALNAAIEAARAGEHGRGFAVVADEVRKLAERSRNSSEEIADLIGQVRKEVANTLVAIENTAREAEAGTALSKTASEALEKMILQTKEVVKETERLSHSSDGIKVAYGHLAEATTVVANRSEQNAAAAQQLSASTNEVADATGRVSDEVTRQAETATAIKETAEQLATSAEELQDVVNHFRLPEVESQSRSYRVAA